MRFPLMTFDIKLRATSEPVLTVFREDHASRIVAFLTDLATTHSVAAPDGEPLAPLYQRQARVVELPYTSYDEARAAYFTFDEGMMNRVLDEAVAKYDAERAPPTP